MKGGCLSVDLFCYCLGFHIILMQKNHVTFRFLWRQFYWCKWTSVFTLLPQILPSKFRLYLHHRSAKWNCNSAELSQHWYTKLLRVVVHTQLSWLSRYQRWSFSCFTSPGQTMWHWDPCSHPVHPEPTEDEVSTILNENLDIEITQVKYFRFHSDGSSNMGGFQIEYSTISA